jgi:hypothetical protein
MEEVTDIVTEQLPDGNNHVIIDNRVKVLMYALRQALLLMVVAIEIFLDIPRTKPPTHR